MKRLIFIFVCMAPATLLAQNYINSQLPWHDAVLDAQGKLLAWHHPEKNQGYDQVMRLGWDFLEHKVPNDTRHGSGLKIYLINAVFDAKTLQGANWQGNPASTFGQFVDALAGWYPYSGDADAVRVVREMLDHRAGALRRVAELRDLDAPVVLPDGRQRNRSREPL